MFSSVFLFTVLLIMSLHVNDKIFLHYFSAQKMSIEEKKISEMSAHKSAAETDKDIARETKQLSGSHTSHSLDDSSCDVVDTRSAEQKRVDFLCVLLTNQYKRPGIVRYPRYSKAVSQSPITSDTHFFDVYLSRRHTDQLFSYFSYNTIDSVLVQLHSIRVTKNPKRVIDIATVALREHFLELEFSSDAIDEHICDHAGVIERLIYDSSKGSQYIGVCHFTRNVVAMEYRHGRDRDGWFHLTGRNAHDRAKCARYEYKFLY
jgi:hypothetical protein